MTHETTSYPNPDSLLDKCQDCGPYEVIDCPDEIRKGLVSLGKIGRAVLVIVVSIVALIVIAIIQIVK